jgi:nucleoside-diphosphate-sugar epimerase
VARFRRDRAGQSVRILVTGGTGFVGRPVVDLLERQGHDLLVVTRDPERGAACWPSASFVDARESSLSHSETMSSFAPDTFLHMAWEGLPDYSPAVSCRNLELGFHFLSLALSAGARRLVGVGTCLEYGTCLGPQAEVDAPLELPETFPQAKIATHALLRSAAHQADLEYRWARPFYIYGPGQRETSLMPSALRAARAGTPMQMRDQGVALDFVHVDDVARGLATLTTDPGPSGAFNLGSGIAYSTQWVADTVFAEASGGSRPDGQDVGTRTDAGWWADIALMESSYGWRPSTDIRRGIRELVASGVS